MKYIITIFIFIVSFGCTNQYQENNEVSFNSALANELAKMATLDQIAARNAFPPREYQHLTQNEWEAKKDSVFRTHKMRLEEVLNKYGYPGYDLIGKEGEKNFWLMVQHSDFDPKFQKSVLEKLQSQVEIGNADGRNFGLLTDRINLNTGQKQVYGTQVTYVQETGQAIPKPLQDSLTVNKRRKSVGLEPIEEYLNRMSVSHFNMNKNEMLKRGITEPKLYEIKK